MSRILKEPIFDFASEIDVDHLMQDHDAFNQFVYTPAKDAFAQLAHRSTDDSLPSFSFVPDVMKHAPHATILRHIITPNFEIRRFVSIADALDVKPLLMEYTEDKFTSNNELKYHIGNMAFYLGKSKNHEQRYEKVSIIDFNVSNGKRFSQIKTRWGQSLTEFHRELFARAFPRLADNVFDISSWYKENGSDAKSYYKSLLSLALKDTVLFENFLLEGEEGTFTREVFLPNFIAICKETGYKPLIVALEPTSVEGDLFWYSHPRSDKTFVDEKLGRTNAQSGL